jgi:uncharacterized repeat protein (TIGR02543 family)
VVTVRPILATAALAAVLASTLVATPAFADSTAGDLAAIQDAFAAPDGSTLTLDADIAAASTVLTLAADGVLTLDLAGHDLTLRSIILGTGSNLTITDSIADAPGTLTADASDGYVPQYESSACVTSHSGTVGIGTTGATLTINGTANVIAAGGPGSAGIGGGRHEAGGTVLVGGHANVTASSGRSSGAIGGGCYGAAGTITITDHATVFATTGFAGSGIGAASSGYGGSVTINGDATVTTVGIGNYTAGVGAGFGGRIYSLTIGGNAAVHISLDHGTGITAGGTAPILIGGSAHVDITPSALGASAGEVTGIDNYYGYPTHITDNAVVTATAGHTGSAIAGTTGVTIDGSATVDARGSATSWGFENSRAAGTSLTVGSDAQLTVSGGSSTTKALRIRNEFGGSFQTKIDGTLHVAAGAIAEFASTGIVTGSGYIDGPGTVSNLGTISLPSSHVTVASVTGHNYLLTLVPAGGTVPGGVTSVRVLATSLYLASANLPTPTRTADWVFAGWFSKSGTQIENASPIAANLTLTAHWLSYQKSVPRPQITGGKQFHTTVGTTVTASTANAPDAGTPTFQWIRDSKSISGATGQTYTIAPADLAHNIRVKVVYHREGYVNVGVTSGYLYWIAAGTLGKGVPAITGVASVGSVLTANPGDWSPTPTFRYQWYADGVKVSKATHSTFRVPSSLNGRVISVIVSASHSGYHSAKVRAETDPVSDLPALVAGTVTVTGSAIQGSKLVATSTPWAPKVTLHYQWYSDGRGIVGATHSSYVPAADTVGTVITVRVTGTAKGHTSQWVESDPTSAVLGSFTLRYLYLSDGKYTVNRQVEVFTLSPNTEVNYQFQWTRTLGGVTTDIEGATSRYYRITTADKGALLQSRVTMSKAGYVDLTRTTKNSIKVSTK